MKTKLVDLLQRAYEEEQKFIAGLTGDERSAAGRSEHWSAKDIVAHVAEWKARMAQRLACARRNETPPRYGDDIDQINAEIFEAHRNLSWADMVRKSERAQDELIRELHAMSEGDLTDGARFPWQNGRPLWRYAAGNGYSHPIAHFAQVYGERGDREYAIQMQESAAQLLAFLDDSPAWQGITLYNLACMYAQSGLKEEAIRKLGESLRLNPELTEWSKQDPDLTSLREEPAYRALYSK